NLRKDGFPVDDDAFLGLGVTVKGCEQIGSDKRCRRELIGRSYRVLMQFGDQLGDFVGVDSNTPAHRADNMKPYELWIGERWWVLPNTMYGSWQPAQFNNVWAQPLEDRRKAEINALDTATGSDTSP
ncbi:MAG TPA: HAD family acid phosphatase, partial [Pseudomonadales bacterium]|nr:HAD family acid phosphatase [Pseudomonadales bacterium]